MHYYQFNIGDYASHTGYLSLLEDLAYRRLLDAYYLSESPFPDDPKQVARLVGMRDNVDEVAQVLQDFFVLENGFYHNKRVDQEIELYHAKAVTARANGKKGGRPRKGNETQNKPSANPEITQPVNLANPEITGSQANHKPITNNHKPITKEIKTSRFAPPSINDISDYMFSKCQESRSTFDKNEAGKFFDYYESNGWKVGKNKMKNWKAAASGWLKRNMTNDQQRPQGASQSNRKPTPAEQTRAAAPGYLEERARREGNGQAMASDAGDVWPPMEQCERPDTNGNVGTVIDGDYSRSNS